MALVGLAAFIPLHSVIDRRGFTILPAAAGSNGDGAIRLPTMRTACWLLLVNLVIMIAIIGLAVGTLG